MAYLLTGDMAIDDRGKVKFVNDFNFKDIKRFYQVENHQKGFIRAWHGHKTENKYIYVASGSALVGVVNLASNEVERFVLSGEKPMILWAPPNSANGFMNLEDNTIVFFFSSHTLAESAKDDIRFPYDQWNIWNIPYR